MTDFKRGKPDIKGGQFRNRIIRKSRNSLVSLKDPTTNKGNNKNDD